MSRLFRWISQHWLPLSMLLGLLVAVLSLYPLPKLPDTIGGDKLHHFIGYGAIFFPIALRQPKGWLFFGLLIFMGSGLIELIQPYVNRYGEWYDLFANGAGVITGGVMGSALHYYLSQRTTKTVTLQKGDQE